MLVPARDEAGGGALPAEWEIVLGRARVETAEDPSVVVGPGLPPVFAALSRTSGAAPMLIIHVTGFGPEGLAYEPPSVEPGRIVAVARSLVLLDAPAAQAAPLGTRLIVAEGVLERGAPGWLVREVAKGRSAADVQQLVRFKLFADASLAPMREG